MRDWPPEANVNSASDDAAGLAIAKGLESRVSGLNQAVRNVNDGISMVQIMEGTYDEVTNILSRMRDLAVQAANGSPTSVETTYLQTEVSQLTTSVSSALDQAMFGSVDLAATAHGTGTPVAVTIQFGPDQGDSIAVTLSSGAVANVTGMGIDAINLTSDADAAIGLADAALASVASQRATLVRTKHSLSRLFAI